MKDSVWFTYKARIQAAERLSSNNFHSQALLVWYAFFSAALAIVTIRYPKIVGEDTDLFSAVLGVGLLVVSMFVTSQDFRGRAISMRSNYIALQLLYKSLAGNTPNLDQITRYNELLSSVENHSEMDDKQFRVFQNGLTTRMPSRYEKIEVHAYMALRATTLTLLYAAPFALVLLS
ncbi:SLATT domain-containing protein [Zoogloea sp.]|uniref:SLATT domain-containing protein n=1 Tax=Zoogloea sp. TaxID=49181 RepID=UPI0035AD9934